MIKRTLYFGNDAYLHTKNKQLVVKFPNSDKADAQVPIEDIGVVILDAFRLSISQNLMTKLLQNNVALITCDDKHMPIGLFLNLEGHYQQQEHFQIQLKASLPLKKQLWQQTIKAKIANQRTLLYKATKHNTLDKAAEEQLEYNNMEYWQRSVRSGDPDNYEARAAAYYWPRIFADDIQKFKRGRFEAEPNHLLNYGYAILRAVTARSLVASGLLPTFGIHHHNKYNAYALADDIMEPYRPYVDGIVLEIVKSYSFSMDDTEDWELTPDIKKLLLQIPAIDVYMDGENSPLMIAMQRTTASLFQCFAGVKKNISYPSLQEG